MTSFSLIVLLVSSGVGLVWFGPVCGAGDGIYAELLSSVAVGTALGPSSVLAC